MPKNPLGKVQEEIIDQTGNHKRRTLTENSIRKNSKQDKVNIIKSF